MARGTEKDILSSGAGLAAAIAVESGTELGELAPVEARSYWNQVWRSLRKDKLAIASGIFIIFLVIIAAVGGPIAERILGHGPSDIFFEGVNDDLLPVGPLTRINTPEGGTTLLILGADGTLGRDEFLRLLYGARVSLEVAVLATLTTTFIGVMLGSIAGYFRGWVDTVISRVIEVVMAFPVLIFIIALAATVGDRLNDVTFGFFDRGVLTLLFVFTIFGWFYPARIVRSQVLSLREKEFVEAARMVGASDMRIVKSHILPHLVAPIIVVSTLSVAGFVLAEAGLSFLGLGVKLPTPSWGNLLAEAPNFYTTQPWLLVWPGLAVLLTTLAFNLLGDGLRDAFDPRSAH
ncbi:MAG: ABC transporter permease [Actinomycetota bacterium]|nr:ABC transporter permease [Actinomycetota bacterium]